MTDANTLLEQEPELKALIETISKRNGYINAASELIKHLLKDITPEKVDADPQLKLLVEAFMTAGQRGF